MLKRTLLTACGAAAILMTAAAYAQDTATLTLRSGERVSGQLVDLGGIGYTIRVNGAERQVPQNDVAVIDFSGGTMSDADWAKFTGPSIVVLRDGETVNGSLYDISGTSPLKLTIRTNEGDREIASTDVARIIMAKPDAPVGTAGSTRPAPATPEPAAVVPGSITVTATQPWTATTLHVRKDQRLTFSTTGEIQLSDDAADIATADGSKRGRHAPNAQMKDVLAGALIGRIGPDGQPFAIGTMPTIVAPGTGILYLGVNDDGFADNHGGFQVVVR